MGLGADPGPEQARFSQEGRWGGGHLCASCPPLPPGHAGRSSAWLCFWPAGSVPTPAHGQRGGLPPPGGSAASGPRTRGAPLSPPHVHPETWEEPGGRLTARPMCSWQSQAGIPPCPPLSSPPFNTHTHTHPPVPPVPAAAARTARTRTLPKPARRWAGRGYGWDEVEHHGMGQGVAERGSLRQLLLHF